MQLANTAGTFKLEDTVFQGNSIRSATAKGIVMHYNPDNDVITLGATQGTFEVNNTIHAASTNGVAQITTLLTEIAKVVEIKIEPDPTTAQPGDDYGYITTITEWPESEA